MRAKRLFVITLGYDQSGELNNGAKSLADRLVGRANDGVALVKVHSAQSWVVMSWTVPDSDPFSGIDVEKDIGIYLIGHHGLGTVGIGGYTVENVIGVIEGLGFKHIRKLCLLACYLDRDRKNPYGAREQLSKETNLKGQIQYAKNNPAKKRDLAPIEKQMREAQDRAQTSYLGALAKGLSSKGINPLIAGWDSFVTACYPGNPVLKVDAFKTDANAGRKVVEGVGDNQQKFAKPNLTSGEESASAKKTVVRWEPGSEGGAGQLVLDIAGWSDKNRIALQ